MRDYVLDSDPKGWAAAGLKEFGDYSSKVKYFNQEECGEYTSGEWFYADDGAMTIYFGSYGNYNAPGSARTYAQVYDDREEFDDAVEDWETNSVWKDE